MSIDLRGRLTMTVPEAGEALGIGRSAAYAAADRGDIPTLRLGRRVVVPVPKLLALLGATPEDTEAGVSTTPATATVHALTMSGDPSVPPDPAA